MPRIRLTWREASGDLPMVCPYCGDDAEVLVTTRMREEVGRFRVLVSVHRTAEVTLPRCRRHRQSGTHIFTLHVRWIEEDYIEFTNAHRDFVDAVENRDERRRRRRRPGRDRESDWDDGPLPRRPAGAGAGWLVALLVVGAVGVATILSCLVLLPFVKVQNGVPPPNQQPWPNPPPGPGQPRWR